MEITIIARNALNNFIKQYGVEPHGLMMNSTTFELWKIQRPGFMPMQTKEESMTFRGLPIYRSNDIEENKIRFVI